MVEVRLAVSLSPKSLTLAISKGVILMTDFSFVSTSTFQSCTHFTSCSRAAHNVPAIIPRAALEKAVIYEFKLS